VYKRQIYPYTTIPIKAQLTSLFQKVPFFLF
jgi:hypothetical protein